jgi:hypothetical protein
MSIHDVVMFFHRPHTSLRVDFLKVDPQTMAALLENAVEIEYFGGLQVKVPRLKDLIAMKLFALHSGEPGRRDKDFPDIVNLVIANHWNLDADLKPLCGEYASAEIYNELRNRIQELRNA